MCLHIGIDIVVDEVDERSLRLRLPHCLRLGGALLEGWLLAGSLLAVGVACVVQAHGWLFCGCLWVVGGVER